MGFVHQRVDELNDIAAGDRGAYADILQHLLALPVRAGVRSLVFCGITVCIIIQITSSVDDTKDIWYGDETDFSILWFIMIFDCISGCRYCHPGDHTLYRNISGSGDILYHFFDPECIVGILATVRNSNNSGMIRV